MRGLSLHANTGFDSSTSVVACDAEMVGPMTPVAAGAGNGVENGAGSGDAGATIVDILEDDEMVDVSDSDEITENSDGDGLTAILDGLCVAGVNRTCEAAASGTGAAVMISGDGGGVALEVDDIIGIDAET